MLTADDVKRLLRLEPLPHEGGFFAETYRSRETLAAGTLASLDAARPLATAIYYLLEPGAFSAFHRLRADEIYHFYLGDPVELHLLVPDGAARAVRLGRDLTAGERPQAVAPAGAWQGSRLAAGGRWALLGTTVSPGFDYADYERGERLTLAARWPAWADAIATRSR